MKKTLFALLLTGISTTAVADSWLYGGASVGQSDIGDDDTTSYSVHVGTGILPFIGVEVGYNDFGEFAVSNTTVDATSVYLAAKPSLNFGSLQVYGKMGMHSWELTSDNTSLYGNDDDYDLMWGVGADYQVFGPLALGAQYMSYALGDEDINVVSLTATFHFL
ncbi:outer membrane beta-barrel protein [Photobacterium sp. SDRW27]|uniref:outer membrane beta-barrel protein n=1 Tax=Photobacterium obscurum TaxID=2829490 RepID=UPI002243F668|nr:outer membrane beta-barrel protein [Photobacterium obscurum]MCW8332146.1 outer membrane beta-barrel protein [Photobacterium obscurum]